MKTDSGAMDVDALRRAFDEGFSREKVASSERLERFVAVRLARDPFAIRIAEVASLHPSGAVTAVPDAPSGLLGLVGIRGQIAAAWDLATLLGYRRVGEDRPWLALAAEQRDVALAVGHIEGYLQVEVRGLRAVAGSDSVDGRIREAFEHQGTLRRVVSVPALLAGVRRATARTPGAP